MIGEELLFEYALDLLAPDRRAEIDAALAGDPALRQRLDELRHVLDAVPDTLEPVAPPAGGRARLLAAAPPKPRLAGWAERVAGFLEITAAKARELLASIADEARWEASPWTGVTLLHIELPGQYAQADVGFVQVDPGQAFPFHEHLGEERVLVLQGGFTSGGRFFGPGDEDQHAAGSRHDYVAAGGPDLIYLVVLYEGLEFPAPP